MKQKHKVLLGSAALLGLSILGGLTSPTFAANISVTTALPGSIDGQCTFEDAVLAHETLAAVKGCTAGTGTDTVMIPQNLSPVLTNNVVNITKGNLTINGDNASTKLSADYGHQILNIHADGPTTITNLTLTQARTSVDGGAIASTSDLTLKNVLIDDNTGSLGGDTKGGGLSMKGSVSANINLNAENVTFSSNGNANGSAMFLDHTDANLKNVTVSGNYFSTSPANPIELNASNLNVVNSTIENTGYPLIRATNSSDIKLKNSILSANPYSMERPEYNFGPICEIIGSTYASQGNNVLSDGSCGAVISDVASVNNFFLGKLSSQTSPIPTISLLKYSPAIGLGDKTACPATDARGIARSATNECDAGAYELDRNPVLGLYRFSNIFNGEHIFTVDKNEIEFLRNSLYGQANWRYEGLAYTVDEASNGSNLAIHRLRNTTTGLHHFTSDTNEISVITQIGWEDEGIKFYANPVQGNGGNANFINIYRFFNKVNGQHLFTTDLQEVEYLKTSDYGKANWNYENAVYASSYEN